MFKVGLKDMKILFIYNGAENIGIEYLSSYLKSKGHKTRLLFDPAVFSGNQLIDNKFLAKIFSVDELIVKKAILYKPDLIAFSTFTGNYQWCLKMANDLKKQSTIPIVFGGVHTTAVPQEVLKNSCVDYVIIGEAEEALIELMENLGRKNKKNLLKMPNLGYRIGEKIVINSPRPYIRDLNSLPFPDKSLFYDKVPLLQHNYLVITSRGCPFDCTYCSNNMSHALYCNEVNHLRRRNPQNVIEELKWAKKKYNIKLVSFIDDVFTSSKKWLEEFIPLYKKEIGIPFFCSVHPNTVSEDIVNLLKSGGCWFITMGVQSASERIRKDIFHRHCSNSKMLESVSYIKKAGIIISLDNIFGAPTEKEKDLKMGLDFYNQAKPDRLITFWLTYYPNTQIIETAKKHHYLSDKDIDDINNGKTGFAHGGGSSFNKKKRALYLKYELLLQLRALISNDKLYKFFSKIVVRSPFKGVLVKVLILLTAIKNKDVKAFYLIRYVFSKKQIP